MGILYVSYTDACPGNGHVPKRVGKKQVTGMRWAEEEKCMEI